MYDEIKLEYLERTNGTKSFNVAEIRYNFTMGGYLFVAKSIAFFFAPQ